MTLRVTPDLRVELHPPIPVPLYEIQVPAGMPEREARICELATQLTGGCQNRGTITGIWTDKAIGQTIREPMTVFQVAAEANALAAILYEVMILYPNERAIYCARIGTAEIIDRASYISRAGVRARVDEIVRMALEPKKYDPDANYSGEFRPIENACGSSGFKSSAEE